MKLSEVICKLQSYYNENGDSDVTVTGSVIITNYDDDGNGKYFNEYFVDEEIYDIYKLDNNHITLEIKTIDLDL